MAHSPDDIKAEVMRRLRATQHLINFTKFTVPDYIDEPMHHLICSYLDQIVNGTLNKLIITTPPQVGKSRLVSNTFPAFWFGRRPNDPIILSSYAASLAEFHSQRARDILESAEYNLLFPKTRIRSDTRAKEFWLIDGQTDGGMLVAGVGGGVTGHPAKLGIVDDPISNDKEAQSQTMRDSIWEWFLKSFRPRIRPDGATIVCMTRWHEDDLVGRILNDPEISKEGWAVLRIPAINEKQEDRDFNNRKLCLPVGEPDPLGRKDDIEESCSPIRWPTSYFQSVRRGSLLTWICLYQNAPIGIQGIVIKKEMFKYVAFAPANCVWVRYWDKAGTENGGKFTAGVLLGYERFKDGIGGNIFIADVVRGQWAAATREPIIKATAEHDFKLCGPGVQTWIEQEGGSGGLESAQSTVKNLTGFNIFKETVSGDKMTRAQPFIGQLMGGNVYIIIGTWNEAYTEEWIAIPNGKYMDQVDASSGGLAHAVDIVPNSQPQVSGERPQMEQAMKRLPNPLYRGIAQTNGLRYANNRYVTIHPKQHSPFGGIGIKHE